MDSNAITVSVVVSAVTGGLAGAILNSVAQRRMQKRLVQASLRQNAIQDLKAWTSKAYELYMIREATWAGANRPPGAKATMSNPEYMNLRNAADLAIKTTFDKDLYADFKDFAERLENSLFESFARGELLPFEDFHVRREELVKRLLGRLWR